MEKYDICINGCYMYYIGDNRSFCPCCNESRYNHAVNDAESSSAGNKPRAQHQQLPLHKQLAQFLSVKENLDKIESYKSRRKETRDDEVAYDVFDGQASKFLEDSSNQLCLAIHVDGFNPFKRGGISMTMIMVTILDLPPEERVKQENILVIDIVPPNPKKTKQDLFSFL